MSCFALGRFVTLVLSSSRGSFGDFCFFWSARAFITWSYLEMEMSQTSWSLGSKGDRGFGFCYGCGCVDYDVYCAGSLNAAGLAGYTSHLAILER